MMVGLVDLLGVIVWRLACLVPLMDLLVNLVQSLPLVAAIPLALNLGESHLVGDRPSLLWKPFVFRLHESYFRH